MTPQESAKSKAAVMLAFAEGKAIECRSRADTLWVELDVDPYWNWDALDYRIKREPRTFWVNMYSDACFNAFTTKERADEVASSTRTECIRVREIL